MNRRVWAVALAAALAASMAVSAPSAAHDESPGPRASSGPAPAPGPRAAAATPAKAAQSLASQITSGEIPAAVTATKQALGWGGITVREPGVVHVKSKGPRAAFFSTPLEALNLAMEARQRNYSSRMTLAEQAKMMRRFGFPFKKGAAGKQMVRFLKLWVAQAKKRTKDPRSFTPLFLHHMARAQVPPVNLATGNYHPDELRLSLLEIELLSAAFMRVRVKGVFPKAAANTRTASEPCSAIQDLIKQDLPLGGEAVKKQGISMLIGEGLEKALEKAFTAKKAKAVAKIVTAAKIAGIISKLIGLYGTVTIYVEPHNPTGGDHYKIHKPIAQQNVDADHRHQFMAIAGLRDEDWAAYQKEIELLGQTMSQLGAAAKDCLEFLGIPTIPDVGDFAKDLTKWKVTWSPTHDTAHSVVDVENSKFDFPGHFAHMLRRISDYQGAAVMVARVRTESAGAHKNGKLKRTRFIAQASLDMSDTPSLGTFIDAMTGPLGLATSIVELSAGWMMSMAQPKAHNALEIEYHDEVCPFSAVGTRGAGSDHGRDDGTVADEPICGFPKALEGTVAGTNVTYGGPTETWSLSVRFDLQEQDGNDFAAYTGSGGGSFSLSGTGDSGCSYSGGTSWTQGTGGSMQLYGNGVYGFNVTANHAAWFEQTITCNGSPSTTMQPVLVSAGGSGDPWTGTITGEGEDARDHGVSTWSWTLTPVDQ